MALKKKQRQVVWEKSGGRCWYCGCELPERGWHADHFEPVLRQSEIVRVPVGNRFTHKIVPTGEVSWPERDKVANMVPACSACNLFKSAFSVEFFRKEIEAQIERARRSSVNFRTAERFGLIEAKPKPVVFWFEAQGV